MTKRLRAVCAIASIALCATASPYGDVNAVAFSPNGKTLAVGALKLSVIDVATQRAIWEADGHASTVRAVVFSPDGRLVASGSKDKTVRLWDVGTGEETRAMQGHKRSVNSACEQIHRIVAA